MRGSGNKPFQRAMNRALVLQALRARPLSSRRDLAAELGLDRSTISNITGELIDAGLLAEISREEAAGDRLGDDDERDGYGRPPVPPKHSVAARRSQPARAAAGRGRPAVGLRVLDERLCAVGLEVTANGYAAIVRDNAGAVRYRESDSRPVFPRGGRFGD
ncbi:MAG: MarR family transcriptional regulator, partial [Spirochaetales bacterium]